MYNNTYLRKDGVKMNYYDKEPQFVKKQPSKLREHFRRGMTTLVVIVVGVLFFFAVWRFDELAAVIGKVFDVLMPIIYGLVIAFLLNPIVKRVEQFLSPRLKKVIKKEQAVHKTARSVGVIVSFIIAIAVITALFNMLIPELYKSIYDLVVALPSHIDTVSARANEFLHEETFLGKTVKSVLLESGEALEIWFLDWVQNDLLRQTNNLMTSLTEGVIGVVNGVVDILIGFIVAIYLLFGKEKFLGQCRKMVYAFNTPRRANIILHLASKTNKTFSGFIIGKIIDSAIIGVLCFIGLSILKMPYTLLVSVIVGVTNVIPVFGPYIGAIPSAILILLVDPMKGLYFVIFIFLLQQLDGNVIGPMILGDSTGLSAFWVMFAILIGGGLFGLVGMIVGVPTFAVIYYIIKMFIQQKLEQKKLPVETENYNEKNYVGDDGTFVVPVEEVKEEEIEDADSSTE